MNKSILLVEDNPDDEELTTRALRLARVTNEVVVARDGVEALEHLFGLSDSSPPPPPPMLVLLDLHLPKVDGLTVLRRIRSDPRTALTPVVILTASDEQNDLLDTYREGTNAYLRKPVKFADFAEVVRVLGLFWLVVNVPPPSETRGHDRAGAAIGSAASP